MTNKFIKYIQEIEKAEKTQGERWTVRETAKHVLRAATAIKEDGRLFIALQLWEKQKGGEDDNRRLACTVYVCGDDANYAKGAEAVARITLKVRNFAGHSMLDAVQHTTKTINRWCRERESGTQTTLRMR